MAPSVSRRFANLTSVLICLGGALFLVWAKFITTEGGYSISLTGRLAGCASFFSFIAAAHTFTKASARQWTILTLALLVAVAAQVGVVFGRPADPRWDGLGLVCLVALIVGFFSAYARDEPRASVRRHSRL